MDDKAFINQDLIESVDLIEEGTYLVDETTKQLMEDMHISELDRIADCMGKRELIAVCMTTVRKYPFAYLQVLADWILKELIGRKRKRRGD